MVERVWRGQAPIWLRILAGILLFPALWIIFATGETGLFQSSDSPTPGWLLLAAGIVAGPMSWIIARRSSVLVAVALSGLALFVLGWFLQIVCLNARDYQDTEPFLGP
jgi:hypothetical protein